MKSIKGYEDLYLISKTGRIFSKITNRYKVFNKSTKYLRIDLYKNGKVKWFSIHRLVALNFIPNPLKKLYVNHKDGNKLNNNVSNLEWVTHAENIQHSYKIGTHKIFQGENRKINKLTNKDVLNIVKLLNKGITQRKIANMFNVTQTCIGSIYLGKTWYHITNKERKFK